MGTQVLQANNSSFKNSWEVKKKTTTQQKGRGASTEEAGASKCSVRE